MQKLGLQPPEISSQVVQPEYVADYVYALTSAWGVLAHIADDFRLEPALYTASVDDLLERLRRLGEELSSVMVIGHNPALHTLLATLAPSVEKFPTGALATLTFTGMWAQLGDAPVELTRFVRPRDLG